MEKILIVDDDPDICKLLQTFLTRKGYKCSVALNAMEGLKILNENPVDLVISDFRMPDIDGVEFLKK